MKKNKHMLMQEIDAAWMNLAGVLAHRKGTFSAGTHGNDLEGALQRVELARTQAGLLPLEELAFVFNPVFH